MNRDFANQDGLKERKRIIISRWSNIILSKEKKAKNNMNGYYVREGEVLACHNKSVALTLLRGCEETKTRWT